MNNISGLSTTIIIGIIVASSANVCVAQLKFGNATKIEESNVKQGGTTPVALSSRFLDLGGVISQLFSGFNQGGGGTGPGLNLPPNSQFYPGVPAQPGNFQQQTNNGNQWTLPNVGNNQNGGIQNQQQGNRPFQNTNNLQSNQNQGWPNFGPNWNNQNNNPNPSQGFQQTQIPGRLTTVPWNSNQGNVVNNGADQSMPSRNEGTLDDFFTNKGTTPTSTRDIIFPDKDNNVESSTKNSIWGKKVVIPTTTPSDNIVFLDDSVETPSQKECVQNCPTTSEYNPVCGTDDVTYFNLGRLICAKNCGIKVFEARRGNCRPTK